MPSDIPTAEETGIKDTLGCIAIGSMLGTALWGITALQTFIYYRKYPLDSLSLKGLVALLFILDTLTSIFIGYALYDDMVNNFNKPENYLVIQRSLALENGTTVVIATIAQCFFAHRLWLFGRNRFISGGIVALSVGALGPGLGITANLFIDRSIFSLESLRIRLLAGFANGLSVICDVTIAIGLCFHLQAGRSGLKATNSLVDRLMLYAINRGALTALCQAGHMITAVAFPRRFLFLPFAFMQGKLYCNTLMATLNVRQSLRRAAMEDVHIEIDTRFLRSHPIEERRGSDQRLDAYETTTNRSCPSLDTGRRSPKEERLSTLVADSIDHKVGSAA